MKAIQYSHFDLPEPFAQGGEVLIDVTASGVNCVDIRERQGVYQRPETHVGSDKILPRISGLQVTGRVRIRWTASCQESYWQESCHGGEWRRLRSGNRGSRLRNSAYPGGRGRCQAGGLTPHNGGLTVMRQVA